MIEEAVSQSEAQGWFVSGKYYNELINSEKDKVKEFEKQRDEMVSVFKEGLYSGTIVEGTEGYYELVSSIDEITLAINQSETAIKKYEQTIQQLSWESFDTLQEQISAVADESEFLIELMSNKKLHNDDGQLTDEGKSTAGLHALNYNVSMYKADQYAEEAAKLKKELESDPYDSDLEDRYREIIALQQEHILNAEQEKNAIKDLVSDGIALEIEALDEKIKKYEESLDSARDLYDYNKKVTEQAETIADLEKQRLAYLGDTSESGKAKLQQIEVSLKKEKESLKETEMDKAIDDVSILLDEIALDYETLLNERLDNVDFLVESMIEEINTNASVIGDTIRESADSVGYELSDSMELIWDNSITKYLDVITPYNEKFSNYITTTSVALDTITIKMQNMLNSLDSLAKLHSSSVKTSSASKKIGKTNSSNKNNTNENKSKSGGDGVPEIGDRVKFVSGQYYYDSQGKTPLGSQHKGEYVYITNINKRGWATHGYHISTGQQLGKGDLGWLKLDQLSGYATGKKNFLNDEYAWTQEKGREFIVRPSDGAILTPVAKGDSVLTSAASNNIWDMANSPSEFIKDNLNFGTTGVPNNSTVQNAINQNFENITFSLPNVKNYEEMLSAMQKDKNFERLVLSMSIDQIAGKSKLAKGKSIK